MCSMVSVLLHLYIIITEGIFSFFWGGGGIAASFVSILATMSLYGQLIILVIGPAGPATPDIYS